MLTLFGWVDDTKTTVKYWESHQVSVRIVERVLATDCREELLLESGWWFQVVSVGLVYMSGIVLAR